MDYILSARRPQKVIVKKKQSTCQIVDFAVPEDDGVENEGKKKSDNFLDLARELKKTKTVEH